MVIDEETQVLFQLLIHAFGLTISLRMICHGGVVLDAKESVEVNHEFGLELRSSVMDGLLQNTV